MTSIQFALQFITKSFNNRLGLIELFADAGIFGLPRIVYLYRRLIFSLAFLSEFRDECRKFLDIILRGQSLNIRKLELVNLRLDLKNHGLHCLQVRLDQLLGFILVGSTLTLELVECDPHVLQMRLQGSNL